MKELGVFMEDNALVFVSIVIRYTSLLRIGLWSTI